MIKKILMLFLVIGCCLSMTACGILSELYDEAQKSVDILEQFCDYISNDEIESAQKLTHPKYFPTLNSLEQHLCSLEQKNNIDFSDGIQLKKRLDLGSTYYDSSYDGQVHEIKYSVVIGDRDEILYVIVVNNENGNGIATFDIE